ncbi:hypothetical protein FNV43_RR21315 [Rhamnella rubrinervis]|uniref:Uncharacterized protein n=1 Tax=Rhamnella rubrinervis TaxID=2594499 RepID=A0A8K0GRB7_9ROSA|nr:hypothetical protein FNV43_RR21315 [Rhamnella rubrinervis]
MENSENKKRARDDPEGSDTDSPKSKLTRVDSDSSTDDASESRLTRVDSDDSVSNSLGPSHVRFDSGESGLDSPEARLIQDDFLNILDETDNVADTDRDPAIQGLDSVIRSFEEEMHVPAPAPAVMGMMSDSGESQPELGYLLEASDDELGLPPTTATGDDVKIEAIDFEKTCSEAVGMDGMLGFEDEVPSYDPYVFGVGAGSNCNDNNGIDEYVALGGLFDYYDESCENGSVSEVAWRSESLPAL